MPESPQDESRELGSAESAEPLDSSAPSDSNAPAEPAGPPPVAPEPTDALKSLAVAALLEITPAETVGAFRTSREEGDGVLSLLFENTLGGYPGWAWTVSLAQVEGEEPTVLETELMPEEGALLAPEWVPWTERLAEYKAQQSAGDADDAHGDDEDAEFDEDDDESDEDDTDESDEDVDDDDEDEDEDDLDDLDEHDLHDADEHDLDDHIDGHDPEAASEHQD